MPYSLGLAPSNFWLFGHIKTSLAGHGFSDTDEFFRAAVELLNEIQPSESQLFHQWVERVELVFANNGDYCQE
jgi:hypothetical protein